MGSIRLKKLLAHYSAPEEIFSVSTKELMGVSGIGESIAEGIHRITGQVIDQELDLAKKQGAEVITYDDDSYPVNLKEIHDPPIVLYLKGVLKTQDVISLAIVGSRRASFYGLSQAEHFAGELAVRGITVISGMARGIDTSAHRGALKAGGRTLAVMGSGFSHPYPPENKDLMEEIAESGVVISEFSLSTPPLRANFPRRNRIISGLSLGVLVVEAARNSGALITADFALEQGREVQFIQQETCKEIAESGDSPLEYLQILENRLGLTLNLVFN